mmetsp:Transcript_19304/g.42066  ORF Transcript_19304/g.42066 Transcript_19304/m.42066 type:complete len:233 (+) Transcript_19304:116-814(+)
MPWLTHQLHQTHTLVGVFLHHLRDGHLEVIFCDVLASLTEGKHASLSADRLALSAARTIHLNCDLAQVDAPHEVHFPRVDLENVQPSVFVWIGKFDLAVDPAGPEQRLVQDIDAIGGHNHLDVVCRLEAIELVKQFKHRPLNLGVTTLLSVHTARSDGVDLVHEDDGGCMLAGHHEELAHHAASLANVLLDQFTARYSDEAALSVVRHCSGQQRLAGSRWSVEQNTLWLGNA